MAVRSDVNPALSVVFQFSYKCRGSRNALGVAGLFWNSRVLEFLRLGIPASRERLGGGAVIKEDDYVHKAADTMQLAQRASSAEDKGRLLNLAEAWLDLAYRAHRCVGRLP